MNDDGDVSIELTQKEFMRLHNFYKRLLDEKELSKDELDFDMFFREVFAFFLRNVKYEDVEKACRRCKQKM